MGTFGLWNLLFRGKWYRCHAPLNGQATSSSPEEPRTLQNLRTALRSLNDLRNWELIPFPSPLHINLDYIYTVDVDAGTFRATRWKVDGEILRPFTSQILLSSIDEIHESIKSWGDWVVAEAPLHSDDELLTAADIVISEEELDIRIYPPSTLNELQFRLCVDFIFPWRFYLDNPNTWKYPSPCFSTFAIAFLRLAAWDLEISADTKCPAEFPINNLDIPRWGRPKSEVFWFHGFLIVLHGRIDTKASMASAIAKAKGHLSPFPQQDNVLLITISLQHVAFVEFSSVSGEAICSRPIPLIVNSSGLQCSPGFRLLTHVLTSSCWKKSLALREKWGNAFPMEILDMVLNHMSSRDIIQMSRASFIAQERYYSTIPQFECLFLRSFKHSVPCCGKRQNLEKKGVYCPCCFVWRHRECATSNHKVSDSQDLCSNCLDGKTVLKFDYGGINHMSKRLYRRLQGCEVELKGSPKILQARTVKPAHLRPELRLLGNLKSISPTTIDYSIWFGGAFSGVVYGFDSV